MTATMSSAAVVSIPEALYRSSLTPAGITFIDRDLREQSISYASLRDAAARAAAELRHAGLEPGDRVCVLGPTTPELVVCLFAVWHAGGVPVVLPLPRRISELEAFLADSVARVETASPKLVLLADVFAAQAPLELPVPVLSVEETARSGRTAIPAHEAIPTDLAFLQFTSGTTARSRAVALTHLNFISNIEAAGNMAALDPARDVVVSWLPLFHDMGLIGMLFGAVLFGIPLVLQPTEEFLRRPGSWLEAISRYRGSITASPNFGYGLAARELSARPRRLDLSSWRLAANGAEPIDSQTLENFARVCGPHGFRPEAMCPMFGLAESTLAVTISRPDQTVLTEWVDREALQTSGDVRWVEPNSPGARAMVSCGHPIPGSEVAIKDQLGEVLPAGRVGEICVRGPSVMQGYWRDEAVTAEVVRGGWLHTGDLGFWGTDGLVVCGRLKDMIILGGRNLYPEDYEFHTERVPGVRRGNVIAFALPDTERMVVVAEAAANEGDAQSVAKIAIETLRRELQRGPEEVLIVPPGTLPKTSSGKRQRSACRDRYNAGELAAVALARTTI